MGKLIKRARTGIAVSFLKHIRREINSTPKVLVRFSGRRGKIKHRIVLEDKNIERRMHELTGLMRGEERIIRRGLKEMQEKGKIDFPYVLQLIEPYREYRQELIELFNRLEEIRRTRKKLRQKARSSARKIAGKKPKYVEAEVISKDNPNTPRLTN